jgi:GntR family transcriptional regulator
MSDVVRATVDRLLALVDHRMVEGLDKLPPERELAATVGVSRGTLRRALEVLEADGVVYRARGRTGGAFIRRVVDEAPVHTAMFELRSDKLVRDLNHVSGVPQMLARQGRSGGTTVVAEGVEPSAANIARLLRIAAGDPVVSLLRVRSADDLPWSLERMYLPAERFPDLLDRGPIGSLYETLQVAYGVAPHAFEEHIEVNPADARVARLLGVVTGAPLFALRRVSWDAAGVPIETSVDFFRADRTRLRLDGRFDGIAGEPLPS